MIAMNTAEHERVDGERVHWHRQEIVPVRTGDALRVFCRQGGAREISQGKR